MTERRVLVGAVIGAHGIKGEVRVKAFTVTPEALGAYGPLLTEQGTRLKIEAIRAGRSGEVVVHFAGVSDRNAAESLRGAQLFVPRDALPKPLDGEYYHADLIGLRAEDDKGAVLGTVRALHNFGAGDVIEIQSSAGETEYIPFTNANVPAVDIGAGRIVIVPPQYDED